MTRQKLSNNPLADFRPVTLQTHVDPVPEIVIRNTLSNTEE